MAKEETNEREENGYERQERIQREQHRPEQDRGYDEAVKGATPASEREILRNLQTPAVVSDAAPASTIDDREADAARMDVRRQEHSAD